MIFLRNYTACITSTGTNGYFYTISPQNEHHLYSVSFLRTTAPMSMNYREQPETYT